MGYRLVSVAIRFDSMRGVGVSRLRVERAVHHVIQFDSGNEEVPLDMMDKKSVEHKEKVVPVPFLREPVHPPLQRRVIREGIDE